MTLRDHLQHCILHVADHGCDREEEELVRMLFERACAPHRQTAFDDDCEDDWSDDLDD